jgi:glycosyltransferase involved in cell wall biosynthesis
MKLPRVAILLSTWNGATYLPEQLDSFLGLTGPVWRLYWRDDGSADGSAGIVRAFAATQPEGRVVDCSDNRGHIGITASFLTLLRRAPEDSLVAFADQDDFWLPDKLSRGVAALSRIDGNTPTLYCARQSLVDATLQPIGLSARLVEPPGFPQALAQNIATGCTVMLNTAAVRLIAASREPAGTLHDWWAYLMVAAAGGRVLVDDKPTVLYRQHHENAVGVPLSPTKRALAAVRRGPGVFMRTFRQHTIALNAQPELLSPEARDTLTMIVAGLSNGTALRMRALRHPGLRRQSFAETQLFRLWYLLG